MAFLMPDISHYQRVIDADKAKKVASAVMLKATEGTGFVDPHFYDNANHCHRAGLPWGAYHYVNQGDGKGQARHFLEVARNAPGCVFLCIDWEQGDRDTARDLAAELRSSTKLVVGLYSGAWSRAHGGPLAGMDFVMVPQYGPKELEKQYYPKGYPLAAWQYTDGPINGTDMPSSIPGIGSCDISVVYRPKDFGLTEEEDMTDAEKKALADATAALRGVDDFLAGTAPADTADPERKQMFRALTKAATLPEPTPPSTGDGTVPPHNHPHVHSLGNSGRETAVTEP